MIGFLLKLRVKNIVCQNHSDVDSLFASGVEESRKLSEQNSQAESERRMDQILTTASE